MVTGEECLTRQLIHILENDCSKTELAELENQSGRSVVDIDKINMNILDGFELEVYYYFNKQFIIKIPTIILNYRWKKLNNSMKLKVKVLSM